MGKEWKCDVHSQKFVSGQNTFFNGLLRCGCLIFGPAEESMNPAVVNLLFKKKKNSFLFRSLCTHLTGANYCACESSLNLGGLTDGRAIYEKNGIENWSAGSYASSINELLLVCFLMQ